MKRSLFNFFAIFSLLMFGATVGMWARSYWWDDYWVVAERPYTAIESDDGELLLRRERVPWPTTTRVWGVGDFYLESGAGILLWSSQSWRQPTTKLVPFTMKTSVGYKAGIPYWFMAVTFLIGPGIWIWRWRRVMQLRRVGHCQKCGYDLRASKLRCPECGTPIRAAAAGPATGDSKA
jgi:hypothetical protein